MIKLITILVVLIFVSGCKSTDISHLQVVEYGRSGFLSDIEETE